jgi:hypothetical protein
MKMNAAQSLALTALIAFLHASPAGGKERDAWFRNLDLAERVASARLIMVAEVATVEEEKVIVGGKGELSVVQIRFRPLDLLKGVYTRSELLLTDRDIGSHNQPHRVRELKAGEVRLLLLDRHSQGYGLAGYASAFDHAVPPIGGNDDSLLRAVRALIEAQRMDKRIDQSRQLLDVLGKVDGAGAVALLRPLQADAVLIAQIPEGIEIIARHLQDPAPAVRAEAAATMQGVLEQDYLVQPLLHQRAAEYFVEAVARDEHDLIAAESQFHGLAALRLSSVSPRLEQLIARPAPNDSLAVDAAQLRAAGELRIDPIATSLAKWLADAPVDVPNAVVRDVALGAIAYDPVAAAVALRRRIERKSAAGLTFEHEIALSAELPRSEALGLLKELGTRSLVLNEQMAFADAAARHPDPALMETLKHWVGSHHRGLRASVLKALLAIDSREAASAARAELGRELDLAEKLRLAAFLGRHGFRDGYAFAVEHMSEDRLREDAVAALVAMRDPRTVTEMRRILETSNDDAWNASAVLVLGGLGEQQLRERFYDFARVGRSGPLPAAAMIAMAELGDRRVLPLVRQWLDQRDIEMDVAAARAAHIALVRHSMPADDLVNTLARILGGGRDWVVTRQAFATLAALDDRRLDEAAAAALRNQRQLEDFQVQLIERLRLRRVRVIPERT